MNVMILKPTKKLQIRRIKRAEEAYNLWVSEEARLLAVVDRQERVVLRSCRGSESLLH